MPGWKSKQQSLDSVGETYNDNFDLPKVFSPSASATGAATFKPLQRWEISFNGNYL